MEALVSDAGGTTTPCHFKMLVVAPPEGAQYGEVRAWSGLTSSFVFVHDVYIDEEDDDAKILQSIKFDMQNPASEGSGDGRAGDSATGGDVAQPYDTPVSLAEHRCCKSTGGQSTGGRGHEDAGHGERESPAPARDAKPADAPHSSGDEFKVCQVSSCTDTWCTMHWHIMHMMHHAPHIMHHTSSCTTHHHAPHIIMHGTIILMSSLAPSSLHHPWPHHPCVIPYRSIIQ